MLRPFFVPASADLFEWTYRAHSCRSAREQDVKKEDSMAKNIWIRAEIRGCQFVGGRVQLEIICEHHHSTGENVHAHAATITEMPTILCFTRGMVNSSQNALVQIADGWAPLGKLSTKFELRHGVTVHKIINDFSRDGDIDAIDTREDAEKLCLLSERFPCCQLSLLEIAKNNKFDIDRISTHSLRSLKNAIDSRIEKHQIPVADLLIDAQTKTLILAGK